MNVTLRADGSPDVMFDGRAHDIEKLELQIRTLLTARRWLKREIEIKKGETK